MRHRPTSDRRTAAWIGGRPTGWPSFELDISPAAPTGTLSLAERQLLEVVKALLAQPKVLLLDEPTTALGPEDVDRLHALVHERSRAGVGIVYVSHRLPEVLDIADRISVLRDGVCQGTFEAASMSEESLVALMIGRPLQLAFPERHEREERRDVLLVVSSLRGDRFGPIDLEVASGEIVGIAGAEGNGQVQFLRALAGAERATGTASCDGKQLDSSSPLGPLRAGVVLLSGDRASESLFPVLSVRANATIQVLRRLGRLGLISRRRERRTVDDLVRRLGIRTASIEQPVQTLSGGNQQKVSLTRPFLRGDVKVILAEEPTQGVDVAARFDIYGALREKAKEGVATIVKSSDPLELAGLCDRVLVMSRGRIVDEIPGDELGERRIVEAIVGSRAGAREHATREPRGAGVRIGRFSGALPLVLMTVLIVAVGAYATVRQDAFLTSFNLNNLLLMAMPLALVSLGQTCALLVGGFDVSVAALMTFCVVLASYTMTFETSGWALLPGGLALIAVGLATGIFNAVIIRVLELPSIIATLGTFSILEGAALLLRDHPEGPISSDAINGLTKSVSFVPIAFIAVVALAVLGDMWLYRTRTGLALRAVGLDETSSRRLGMATGRMVILAFVVCSVMASLAGFYLAAQVQIGSPLIGNFGLESIAAAVLGGAALSGGRGSFVGTLLAALFLSLVDNVLPLFHQPAEYSPDHHRRADPAGARALPEPRASRPPAYEPGRCRPPPGGRGRSAGRLTLVRNRARRRHRRRPRIGLAADDDPDRVDGLAADGPQPVR